MLVIIFHNSITVSARGYMNCESCVDGQTQSVILHCIVQWLRDLGQLQKLGVMTCSASRTQLHWVVIAHFCQQKKQREFKWWSPGLFSFSFCLVLFPRFHSYLKNLPLHVNTVIVMLYLTSQLPSVLHSLIHSLPWQHTVKWKVSKLYTWTKSVLISW